MHLKQTWALNVNFQPILMQILSKF